MALNLPRLQRTVAIVDKLGLPAVTFHQWWQKFAGSIEDAFASIEGNTADIAANAADLSAAQVSLASLDARIDAYDALAPFVRQNQAAFPTYTAYAGQTISNPPTQAEVQALDNAVKALSTAFVGLKTALDTANVLT